MHRRHSSPSYGPPAQEAGKEKKERMNYIGLQPGSIKYWKYAGRYGYMKYMIKSCDYLDTAPNYLFLGLEKEEEMQFKELREFFWDKDKSELEIQGHVEI